MNYTLKNNLGKVVFLLKTGSDFSKNEMSISAAQHIIDCGELVESEKDGYPICVDGKWYFEGEPIPVSPKAGKTKKGE